MKRKLIKTIKDIDIFGVDLGFKIKQKDEYGTFIGGSVFIVYICLTSYFLISYFVTFVNRTTFNQNTINNSLNNAPKLTLNNDKIAFAYGLTVNDSHDDSYKKFLQIQVNHVKLFKSNNSKIKIPINITKCTKDSFNNLIDNFFESNQLDQYYCIDYSAYNTSLIIEGIYQAEEFSYIEYSLTGTSVAMKNDTSFKEYFNKNTIKFSLAYLDTSIDFSNFSSPEISFLNSKYIQLSFEFVFKRNLDFGNNTFVNDGNILFESGTSSHYYTPSNYEEMNTYAGNNRLIEKNIDYNLFARFYLRSSTKSMTMKRTYQKFPEFLADATSIVSEIFFILMLIFGAYNKFRAEECVIDGVMQYKQKLMKKCPNEYNMLKVLLQDNQTAKGNENDRIVTTGSSFRANEDDNFNKSIKFNRNPLKKNFYHFNKITKKSYINKHKTTNVIKKNPINKIKTIKSTQENYAPKKMNYEGSLKHSLFDIIKRIIGTLICSKNKPIKEMMYDKGMSYFLHNMDIFTYFMKMREIDLIKCFLFDSHEINLIDFLSKPSISSVIPHSNSPLHFLRNEHKLSNDTVERIAHSFTEMTNKYKLQKNGNERLEKILKYASFEINQLIL